MLNNIKIIIITIFKAKRIPIQMSLIRQFAMNCYTVVLYYRMFKHSLCKKSALLLLGLASMTFFTRCAGLGYSLIDKTACFTINVFLLSVCVFVRVGLCINSQ